MREELKEKIIFGIIVVIIILIIGWLSNGTQKAYDKCMIENNNNVNFCSKLKN